MLTLERIESLPKDRNYLAFVLKPFSLHDIKEGQVAVATVEHLVDIWYKDGRHTELKLYEYFVDWLNPTPEENTLWTLETGLEPIETYIEQMEKTMKEFK